ncbi:hypothetical protein [Rhodohalobacter sp. SW132]|uniref:hypothetical protein n=1 Tax=Rhodohalobacter sp. SW132 TaxID=2293433 RepID=UPI001314E408|nr:hypothetical protein [Rhodohalobacter sp. SW132]
MKQLEKRISKLEAVRPSKEVMNGLGQYYAWEKTPEGKAELDNLYNPDRNQHENTRK